MKCRERVLATLNHEEPDKVPYWEHLIQSPKMKVRLGWTKETNDISDISPLLKNVSNIKFAPEMINFFIQEFFKRPKIGKFFIESSIKNYYRLQKTLKMDITSIAISQLKIRFLPPHHIVTYWGTIIDIKSGSYIGGFIDSKEKYESFIQNQYSDLTFGANLYKITKKYHNPDDLFIIPGFYGGIFDSTWQSFGIELFSRLLRKDKAFLRKVIKDKEKYYLEIMKFYIDEFNVEAFFIGDDLAYNTGPFIAPKYFRELFFPAYKRLSNMLHRKGVKLIFHTDGDILPIAEDIIEFADAIHPWQKSAGIDIAEVKKQYGDKVTIAGNVPVGLLIHNTQKEIANYVKNLIKNCAPGGGYFFSSANSIVPEIP
ncbi:MAG: hypothetical protein GY870_21580, partial [archaeon]|nr:hypothetical protein [archaeon]